MYASKPAAKSSSKGEKQQQVIQLVLQAAENGNRRDVPGTWTPQSKLTEIMATMESELVGVSLEHATMRYLQKIVPQSEWSTTSLKKMGLKEGGRALLILKLNAGGAASSTEDNVAAAVETPEAAAAQPSKEDSALESSITTLLNSSFDADTKVCIVTLLKVLDNILQKPQNPKVRSIRLANAAFAKKVVERKGAVEFLIACGFEVQAAPPPLLSSERMDLGEECLVLVKEDTSHLVKARRLLMTKAIQDLNMRADDLPKYKPPPRLTEAGDHAAGRTPTMSSGEFDPYKGQRYDAMAAAVGQPIGPDVNYVSPTEQQLNALQSQQKKLESSLHSKPLLDREICASLPNSAPTSSSAAASDTVGPTNTKSDSSLIASQFARQQQERRSKEQQGFTTKAMRDLELLKKRKVYSHAQLRIQFPDGTVLEAKFLPKERFSVVKKVLREECFMEDSYDFDLYVSPPRRKLEDKKTLEAEGLVPAAKVFLSWKVDACPPKTAPIGTFLKASLFREDAKPAYPSARALVDGDKAASHSGEQQPTAKKTKSDKSSREEEMIARMMGKGGGLGGGGSKKGSSGGKPKWFKG